MRTLSYSQVSTYLSCPLSYRLQYIDRLPRKPKSYLSFGSTLHQAVAFFFRKKRRRPPSLDELLSYYDSHWIPHGYRSKETEEKDRAVGREILKRFHELHEVDFRLPLASEQGFTIDLDGIRFRGYFDRVDLSDRGGLLLVDYKSGQGLFSQKEIEDDLQLTLYQLALEKIWLLPMEKLTLYHLRSNTPFDCQPRSASRLHEAKGVVLEVAEAISRADFPSQQNRYCPCDYPEYCPHFSDSPSRPLV